MLIIACSLIMVGGTFSRVTIRISFIKTGEEKKLEPGSIGDNATPTGRSPTGRSATRACDSRSMMDIESEPWLVTYANFSPAATARGSSPTGISTSKDDVFKSIRDSESESGLATHRIDPSAVRAMLRLERLMESVFDASVEFGE